MKGEDDAPLVVTLNITSYTVHGILVDTRSATNLLFKDAFDHTGIPPDKIEP